MITCALKNIWIIQEQGTADGWWLRPQSGKITGHIGLGSTSRAEIISYMLIKADQDIMQKWVAVPPSKGSFDATAKLAAYEPGLMHL